MATQDMNAVKRALAVKTALKSAAPPSKASMMKASIAPPPPTVTMKKPVNYSSMGSIAPPTPKITMKKPVNYSKMGSISAPPPSVADTQRNEVRSAAVAAESARKAAIERQLAARGISDSGILQGQQRTAEQDIRHQAGSQLTQIGIEEQQAAEREKALAAEREFTTSERESGQDFLSGENSLTRTSNEGLTREGYGVTTRGQDLNLQGQREGHGVTTRGQDLNLQGQREGYGVTTRGQDINSSQFDRELASNVNEKALDRDQALNITKLNNEHDFLIFDKKILTDRENVILVDYMSKVDLTTASGMMGVKNLLEDVSSGSIDLLDPSTQNKQYVMDSEQLRKDLSGISPIRN